LLVSKVTLKRATLKSWKAGVLENV
jgi:hypothetical protein